jgi:hypothetical protein
VRKAPSGRESLWCSEGFVNKTDDHSDDSPLDEVSHSLSQSEFQPDVQVHIVVQHSANRENANENAQARTFRSARSPRSTIAKIMATTRIAMKVATNPIGITVFISSRGRNTAGYLWPSLIRAGTSQNTKKQRQKTRPCHQAPPARDLNSSFALPYKLRIKINSTALTKHSISLRWRILL